MKRSNEEHGTARTYVVGFLLSLLFTFIPYWLVTQHLLTTQGLLVVIMAIAVIQMVVQVVFFLHLGREKKPRWQLYFFAGTIVGIVTVVGGSIFIMSNLHHNMSSLEAATMLSQNEGIAQVEGSKTGACQTVRSEHTVVISHGVATPSHVDAHLCDSMVFETDDAQHREIAFGSHPAHIAYAGVQELPVSKGHGNMLILSVAGSYQFHDHLDPSLTGTFTVAQ